MKTVPISADFLEQSKLIAMSYKVSGQCTMTDIVMEHIELIDKMLDNWHTWNADNE